MRNLLLTLTISLTIATELFATTPFLQDRKSPLIQEKSDIHILQDRLRQIYKLYQDSVVFIRTDTFDQLERNNPAGVGSGFILSEDGYLCTNSHVVVGAQHVEVIVSGESFTADVKGIDTLTDLALLKIKQTNKQSRRFVPIYPGNSSEIQVGDFAFAIGNPYGLERSFTFGIVSSISRFELDQPGNNHIQTDAAIHPGNSGGPLINLDGEVIGMNRMIYTSSSGGIGFAIPLNDVLKVVDELKLYGKVRRGFLGVTIEENGTKVTGVILDSPAAMAGIVEGDTILKVDSQSVKNYRDLIRILSPKPAGRKVVIEFQRKNRILKRTISLIERP